MKKLLLGLTLVAAFSACVTPKEVKRREASAAQTATEETTAKCEDYVDATKKADNTKCFMLVSSVLQQYDINY